MEIIMQDFIIFVSGNIFSFFTTTFLVFQYLNEMYEKRYQNQAVYLLLQIAVSTCMVCVNLLDNPIINLIGCLNSGVYCFWFFAMLNISFALSLAIIGCSTFCVHAYILTPKNTIIFFKADCLAAKEKKEKE